MNGTSERNRPAVGAVLAGGRGSRLGGSKATVELAGRALIDYPLGAVATGGLEPLVVAKPGTELPPLDVEVIREQESPRHPLCGIVAALRYAGERPLVVVGCDMPFVSSPLLTWLGSAREPLIFPSMDGHLQPLPGRYERGLLPALERALAAEASLQSAIESLRPRLVGNEELARFGEPCRLCFNVNTPADLEAAERMLETINDRA
ncbi:MAG TPA: NTP transferase domain-containing protein [Solirubrobacterales bacterium]